jgi:hypothetical protein
MSDNEQNNLSEVEEEIENDVIEAPKPKYGSLELFDKFEEMFSKLHTMNTEFIEKEKAFEKDKKEHMSNWKKHYNEIDKQFQKFGKVYKSDFAKATKSRKTGNSGKGGFNAATLVPLKLRTYLEIEDEKTLLPRTKITHLLSEKFKSENFKNEENGKKVIKITSKKAAKVLGCEHNHIIQFKDLQTFIANFYNEEKEKVLTL